MHIIIAARTGAQFITFSAVTSGIKDIKTVMQQADKMTAVGARTIVFADEIHRFKERYEAIKKWRKDHRKKIDAACFDGFIICSFRPELLFAADYPNHTRA